MYIVKVNSLYLNNFHGLAHALYGNGMLTKDLSKCKKFKSKERLISYMNKKFKSLGYCIEELN